MGLAQKIAPCLWFDDQGEEAAGFYTAIFPNSRIMAVTRYSDAGREIHRREPGSVMTVEFELDGQSFTALNGGSMFRFNEAISLQVFCDTQAEIDHYWERLSEGGPGGPAVRLAEGPLRPVVADRPPRHGRVAQGLRSRRPRSGRWPPS